MKYIVVEFIGLSPKAEQMFVFPESIPHDYMAEALAAIRHAPPNSMNAWSRYIPECVSAGFITSTGDCFGRSETLDLESRPDEDTELYRKLGGYKRLSSVDTSTQ